MNKFAQMLRNQFSEKKGSAVILLLRSGKELSGVIDELKEDFVTIKRKGSHFSAVILDEIVAFDLPDGTMIPVEESVVVGSEIHLQPRPASGASPVISADQPLPKLGKEVLERLEELTTEFARKLQRAKVDIVAPDARTPPEELRALGEREAVPIWVSIKNKFDNAARVNELDPRYGRVQGIIGNLKDLIEQVPSAPSLKRHLAYFQYLSNNTAAALDSAEEAADLSQSARDWLMVAAFAVINKDEALACHALEQVFQRHALTENGDVWYVYAGLLRVSGNYALLREIYEARRRSDPPTFSESEEQLLFDTCLYLLHYSKRDEVALDILRQEMEGALAKNLIPEAINWLVGQVGLEYQQMAQKMKAAQEAALRELRAEHVAAPGAWSNGTGGEKRPVVLSTPLLSSATSPLPATSTLPATQLTTLSAVSPAQPAQPYQTHPQQLIGHIYTYKFDRSFGFLFGANGASYFFHRSAIIDEELLDQLEDLTEPNLKPTEQIPVTFEIAQGPKGSLAVSLSLYRKVHDIFDMACDYANAGEYAKAVTQLRTVLARDPDHAGARGFLEKWTEFAQTARTVVAPTGSNPFAEGKRALMIEKDTEKAVRLFRQAIDEHDSVENAIRELALLLGRTERGDEAIALLEQNRRRISNQQSVDNLLIDVYQRAGQYESALQLLNKSIARATTRERKAHIYWQMANCYLQQEDYVQAERYFRMVMELGLDRKAARKNVALCLVKQQKYDEAERLLNEILDIASDAQAVELLKEVSKVKATGQSERLDEIMTVTRLSSFSSEISGFTQFFLGRCKFQGVRPERVQQKKFDRSDVRRLEDLATQLGTRNPRERSEYYLSAARIISEVEDWDDPRQMYKYLCRSFASRGDATVIENRPLDAAREWYCEALTVYDGERNRNRDERDPGFRGDEQDAVNALVRYLSSTLGTVPITPHIPAFDDILEEAFRLLGEQDRLFDQITYLLIRSRYAAQRILNRLYNRPPLRARALQYLKNNEIGQQSTANQQEEFMQLWNDLRRKRFEETRAISTELGLVAESDLTVASLESSIRTLERVKNIGERLLFDLDQQRIRQLQKILETLVDLGKENVFEEQERFCTLTGSYCADLLREIEESPTRLSVEEMYPIVEMLQKKTADRLEGIYASSVPQVTLRLPEDMEERYTPELGKIEVQIVIANRMGCSPAESLELVVQQDEVSFSVGGEEIKLNGSLRGGDQKILRVPLRVTEQARQAQAFSLPLYAQYRTRSGETQRTPVENFSIRLYSEKQFERIENPYATYAKGGTVENREMFYGRDELITNIANSIRSARSESKAVIIYGQKRAGKSSILYHLRQALASDPDLLILDVDNIGSLLDVRSAPFLHQILWRILRKLQWAIEDEVDERGRSQLEVSFPDDTKFYQHPSPMTLFDETFEMFKRASARAEDWHNARLVVVIDEFSYIYNHIMSGRISVEFMQIWKAFLQRNLFNAVMVGQDVMPRFRQRFPNEFGTSQDVRVTYLKQQDAVKLIDDPLRIGGKHGESRFREKAIERIYDLSAGSPFYIQIICDRLVDYMNMHHARLVTEADVEQVKNELVRGTNRLGWDDFDNLMSSGDTSDEAISVEDAKKVLTAIAINTRLGVCDRESVISAVSGTKASIDDILDDLVKRDVIELQQRRNYRIQVELFKEWLLAQM
jgi:tetratricopeptide (TPR) repeat protein